LITKCVPIEQSTTRDLLLGGENTVNRFAEFLVRNRVILLIIIGIITVLFFYQCLKLPIKTCFADLLPQKHPYIQVHNKIRNIFGGANQVLIMVQVREGDIFNSSTLKKVKWISEELEKYRVWILIKYGLSQYPR